MKKIIYVSAVILMSAAILSVICFKNRKNPEKNISENNISSYLLENGWETDPEQFISENVTIPYEFSDTYYEYNSIQKQQGFDLQKHCGETAVIITCPVTNYSSSEPVYAELIISGTRLIGADIYCTGENGFIKPINKH